MYVLKRDGRQEEVHFEKITSRIRKLCYGLEAHVDPTSISQKVIQGVFPGVCTTELDELAAETAASCATQHPDYSTLAARISVSNLHKQTSKVFSDVMTKLYNNIHPKTGMRSPLISEELYATVMENKDRLNSAMIYDRDFNYDYFGFKTLSRAYLMSMNKEVSEKPTHSKSPTSSPGPSPVASAHPSSSDIKEQFEKEAMAEGKDVSSVVKKTEKVIVERPQHMIMRVCLGIHGRDIDAALESYDLMSRQYFIHATPTLFNAGTPKPQLSSCFLLAMQADSIDGIYETLKQCAVISKYAGGIGLSVHNIRANNSYIRGTNGTSNGIVPMLRVFNNTARYVDQGGGKRKGSIAVYLEPWHADIMEFLDLKKNHGNELERARDLFYAMWVSDLFMKRVESAGQWSLFCPNEAPGLADCWGDAHEELYCRYEREGRARKTLPAQELWLAIMASQVETGTPYMLYKDACNRKSNQQNLGTIKSSNLCTEVVEYTAPDEVAVCNLASVNLSAFVNEESRTYDLKRLYEVTKVVTKNLNKVIDVNFYPVKEAENSNKRHRPIGIGVQGLADTFARLRYPFDSAEACKLNRDIFEAMYFAAVESSCELAEKEGTYSTYEGSPMSQGKLQPDMWNDVQLSDRWDWDGLRAKVAQHGVRNSLLLAPMPTASTACIMGNNESTEPFTSNMYNRRVLAGEFTVVNKYLLKDLVHNGLWTPEVRNQIIADRGSIQNVLAIPKEFKDLYKTVWEIPQKIVINQAADRGAFICQSQSLNIHMAAPNTKKMTSMHFYAWKKGLKTGMYYLRTRPKADAIQFTVDQTALVSANENVENEAVRATDVSVKLASDSMHTGAIKGLDTAEEAACESCSA